jgi:hypothetical protein
MRGKNKEEKRKTAEIVCICSLVGRLARLEAGLGLDNGNDN